MRRLLLKILAVVIPATVFVCRLSVAADLPSEVQFNRDIRPILSNHCFACHGPDQEARQAELRLDIEEAAFGELDSGGKALVPGKLHASGLFTRMTASDPDERMPPADFNKPLSTKQIELIRRWIEQGARWEGHWAFRPMSRPELPRVRKQDDFGSAVDRFIVARLEAEGLPPSAEADKVTLIRRLSFDLSGLPPSAERVVEFLSDESPEAYEKLVDRLLDSKHYGERLAMYWLDLVRYADSCGYHSDVALSISPYRDYVIAAFNSNMPFDQFTREQLAGDLLPNPTVSQKIATGYNRLVKTTEEGGAQPGEYLTKYAADRVRTTSGTWMGATLGCAECHDHKYDPYTTKDFYSLAAFFADVDESGVYGSGVRDPEMLIPEPEQAIQIAEIDARLAQLNEQLDSPGPEADLAKTQQQIADLQKQREEVPRTRTMVTMSVNPRTMRILPRGNWLDSSGELVTPAVPQFLPQLAVAGRRLTRLDLADWLVSSKNPLTARVFVNRLWKLLFGTGISKRLDDVGAQGEWPTHPELLDWLAVEFVESGWNVKHMVKLLVMSNTYRQSSVASPKLLELDPLNRLYARQSRWRLDAEMIRDNALATSGLLVRNIGGPSVKPYQPAGYWSHLNFPKRTWEHDTGENQYRRGVYTHWQRTFLHPSLLAFDAPTREECTAERPVSNTPKAALTLLNDPTFVEAARVFAVRIVAEGGQTTTDRIDWAWRHTLSRAPLDVEVAVLARLLDQNLEHYAAHPREARELLRIGMAPVPDDSDSPQLAAWTAVARTLFNLNETITRN